MLVKLLQDRTRGEAEFKAGEEYECSDGEGKALIAEGFAEKLRERKPKTETTEESTPEAAAVVAPEKAVAAKPKARG